MMLGPVSGCYVNFSFSINQNELLAFSFGESDSQNDSGSRFLMMNEKLNKCIGTMILTKIAVGESASVQTDISQNNQTPLQDLHVEEKTECDTQSTTPNSTLPTLESVFVPRNQNEEQKIHKISETLTSRRSSKLKCRPTQRISKDNITSNNYESLSTMYNKESNIPFTGGQYNWPVDEEIYPVSLKPPMESDPSEPRCSTTEECNQLEKDLMEIKREIIEDDNNMYESEKAAISHTNDNPVLDAVGEHRLNGVDDISKEILQRQILQQSRKAIDELEQTRRPLPLNLDHYDSPRKHVPVGLDPIYKTPEPKYGMSCARNTDIVHSFFCEICGKGFTNSNNLSRHKRLHFPPKFSCNFCTRKFYRADHWRSHVHKCKEF